MSRQQSRRNQHHLTLFHTNVSNGGKESNSTQSKQDMEKFEQTMNDYRRFLDMLQNKIQKIYEKENYRIYLNDRSNQKTYTSLIQQKNSLVKAIEQSKDYRQSANRSMIEEVMSLQKQRQEYVDRNNDVKNNIENKRQEIKKKREELKQLQKEIKSYWVYSYDLSTSNNNSTMNLSSSNNQSRLGIQRKKQSITTVSYEDKQNNLPNKNNNSISINVTSPIRQNSCFNLPYISPKSFNSSPRNNQSVTIFSKQLSLINSSPTREKLIQKINLSYKQQAEHKLEYEREKISLLKMFCAYLKKVQEQQNGITDRVRLQKVANQLLEKIKLKQNKLNQIQKLIQ